MLALRDAGLLAFDIDGTLTDATTWWAGEAVGWTQRYSVRDGEAMLRMAKTLPVVPLSRNKTEAARRRMEGLRRDLRWLGVTDKLAALDEICTAYAIKPEHVVFVGDGPDDAAVFAQVGLGLAVADAHPTALASAHRVLERRGGERVMEAIELMLEQERD